MVGFALIVEDEATLGSYLARILRTAGWTVEIARTLADARTSFAEKYPDAVILDLHLPDGDGADLMREVKATSPETAFVVMTAYGSIRSAVELTRQGAAEYLTKPFEPEQLVHALETVIRERLLGAELARLRAVGDGDRLRDDDPLSRFPSAIMRKTVAVLLRAAGSEGSVLLEGDSGTGKSISARWIHDHSARAGGPFFAINCAALPRELAESELFGHEPGAFTGVRGRKRGLLELAEKGTILLDEIGDLDLGLQAKLLTFLDTHSFVRVGGERSVSVDTRILAASNRDLEEAVQQKTFRADLFYRIAVFPVRMPTLAERTEDLPVLVDRLLPRLAQDMRLSKPLRMSTEALAELSGYAWPGNIRELRNVLERAAMLAADGVIRSLGLIRRTPAEKFKVIVDFPVDRGLHEVTDEVARALVTEALRRAGSQQGAAKLLRLSRHAFHYQIKRLGVQGLGDSAEEEADS